MRRGSRRRRDKIDPFPTDAYVGDNVLLFLLLFFLSAMTVPGLSFSLLLVYGLGRWMITAVYLALVQQWNICE